MHIKNVRFSNVVVNHKRPDCHFKELKIDRKNFVGNPDMLVQTQICVL